MYQISDPLCPSYESSLVATISAFASWFAAVVLWNRAAGKPQGSRRRWKAGSVCLGILPPVAIAVSGIVQSLWLMGCLATVFLILFAIYRVDRRQRVRIPHHANWLVRTSSALVTFLLGALALSIFAVWTMVPFVFAAREAASRTQCKGHLKQIELAMYNYHDVYGSFPASAIGDVPYSWRVAILPFVDQKAMFDKYNFQATWDSASNEPFAKTPNNRFQCQSRINVGDVSLIQDSQGRYYTHYAMLIGPNMAGAGVRIGEITDGTSNTILVAEACGLDFVWTEPRDIETDKVPVGINLPSPVGGRSPGWMSSHHPGGVNVAFADGMVRFVSDKIDPKLLRSLGTIDQGEPTGEF